MGDKYCHRDLCSATAGILEAYLEIADKPYGSDIDKETVESIVEAINDKHDELEAETPKARLE